MPRDYGKKQPRKPKSRNTRHQPTRKTAPGWLWMLAGIFIGALITGLITSNKFDVKTPAFEAIAVIEKKVPAAKPHFDFYTLLTEIEEIVPDLTDAEPEIIPKAKSPANVDEKTQPKQPSVNYVYILQAGAFKSNADADGLRARLLLLNMQARVETITPRPGETWHRVLVGPFSDTGTLSEARKKLQQNGIDSIQVKRRG